MMGRVHAIVTGGGTAGHVQPALAIAEALVERGHARSSILFVGSRRGLETELVPPSGFGLEVLPGRGLVRRMSVSNVAAAGGLLVAFLRSLWLLARLRPRVVVSVGGYAGLPCAMAAALWRIPLVLANADAVPGASNRLAGRFARLSAVAFEGTKLPRAVVTGTPVRPRVATVSRGRERRNGARRSLGIPEGRKVFACFGGSLGSRRINVAVLDMVSAWSCRSDIAVRQIVGRRDWDDVCRLAPRLGPRGILHQLVEYEDEMPDVLAAADLAVCRAGATTVAELSVVGLPAILVPLAGAPGDHQTANAEVLARVGGAVVLPDRECTGSRLVREVEALLARPERLESMGERVSALGRPDAARVVAGLVDDQAASRRRR